MKSRCRGAIAPAKHWRLSLVPDHVTAYLPLRNAAVITRGGLQQYKCLPD